MLSVHPHFLPCLGSRECCRRERGCTKNLLESSLSVLWGLCPQVHLRGHVVIISISRKCHAVWHGSCITSRAHQRRPRGAPVTPHPRRRSLFFSFLFFDSDPPHEVRRRLIIALICAPLRLSDVEHLFLCLSAICVSSEQCLFRVLRPSLNRVVVAVVVVVVVEASALHILDGNPSSELCLQIFSLILWLIPFDGQKFFNFHGVRFVSFFFFLNMFAHFFNFFLTFIHILRDRA